MSFPLVTGSVGGDAVQMRGLILSGIRLLGGAPSLLPAGIAEIRGADDVELVQRVYQRIQEAGSDSAVPGDGKVGWVSGSISELVLLPFVG